MVTDPAAASARDEGYPTPAVLAAAIGTAFFPIISLIAALLLLSQQGSPRKRSALKTWAWASFAWVAIQFVAFLLFVAVVFSGGAADAPVIVP